MTSRSASSRSRALQPRPQTQHKQQPQSQPAASWRDNVGLPRELLNWAQSEEGEGLFSEVCELTGATSIAVETERRGLYMLAIMSPGRNESRAAKSLLELHISHQVEYQARMEKHQQLQNDLEETNREFQDGLRVEFKVPRELLGLVIGKGGAHVNEVKSKTGVERIVVDPRSATVRIKGSDADSVAQARSMLEYADETLPLKRGEAGCVIGGGGAVIKDIRFKSGCTRVDVDTADDGTECVRILGTVSAVTLAKTLITTHLKYNMKFQELQSEKEEITRRLAAIDTSFAENPRRGPSRVSSASARGRGGASARGRRKGSAGTARIYEKAIASAATSADPPAVPQAKPISKSKGKAKSQGASKTENANASGTSSKKPRTNKKQKSKERADQDSEVKQTKAEKKKESGSDRKEMGKTNQSRRFQIARRCREAVESSC